MEAVDFVNLSIERSSTSRLGANGSCEVKNHPWLRNFPWEKLLKKELSAPFLPITLDSNSNLNPKINNPENAEII